MQVELAHLSYQKSRLVRSWTHLERQRGGFGFLGGPGETQIESDRRIIGERIDNIRKELEQVKRTRALHRKSRERVPYPSVALVGYTNAGKSTLFNALTGASVLAEDILFATLDPTIRALPLPGGSKAVLSDTVGFISDLPTTLIAAFRATLEEVLEADLILHVRDIADPSTASQRQDVIGVLAELGIDVESEPDRVLEVWNKADLLDEEERKRLEKEAGRAALKPVLVSAMSGIGLDKLRSEIEQLLNRARFAVEIEIGPQDGALANWIYEHCEVIARDDLGEGAISLRIRVAPEQRERLQPPRRSAYQTSRSVTRSALTLGVLGLIPQRVHLFERRVPAARGHPCATRLRCCRSAARISHSHCAAHLPDRCRDAAPHSP